ncbi:uncharacterized protein LOC100883237 [Megachile rotundata]|uniref:uncharacterized protein LOC100883237 n=1 Tax=Megachile rotundata TaxID=143995 RepID=UPI000258D581|nr:PREDICTED: uncharacterized protein LOC100883237 [Megachile rotundata]
MGKMRIKVTIALTIALAVSHRSRGGVIPLEDVFHGQQETLDEAVQQGPLASSYVQFHGPVEGPEFEVKVPYAVHHDDNHLHGQDAYTVDYVAHPKYEFSYGVEDQHTGDFHSQKESRDGNSVSGSYSVKEPGGSIRTVSYRADKDGFHAVVHTSGKNDHSVGMHPGQGQPRVHDHEVAAQQEQQPHDYAASYNEDEGY